MQNSKSFKLHFKNPFDSAFNDANDTAFLQGIEQEFNPKTYDKEHKDVFMLCFLGSFLCNCISGATEATHIQGFLSAVIPYTGLVTALLVLCLLFLEAAKRFIAHKLFKQWIQYKKIHWGFFLAAFALMCFSTYLSYLGAKRVIFATAAPVILTDVNAVTNEYDNDIARIESAKKAYYEANTVRENGKEVLGYKARKQYAEFDKNLLELSNRKQTAKEKVVSKNDTKETENHIDTTGRAEYFAAFTVIIEVLLLVCVYYVIYYKYRSYVDRTKFAQNARQKHENEASNYEKQVEGVKELIPQESSTSDDTSSPKTNLISTERNTIGFHTSPNATTTQSVNKETQSVIQNVAAKYLIKVCKNCGKEYERKVTFQKFCTATCRYEFWEKENGMSVKTVIQNKQRKAKK